MKDKICGKLYLNGTCVQYPEPSLKRFNLDDTEKRNRTNKTFKMKFKQRMKIYDAITYQNFQANQEQRLNHCFITLTFPRDKIAEKPNKCLSNFWDKMRKKGFVNYVWVREVGEVGGLLHYHASTVGPFTPINANNEWNINRCWCDSRGYYSPNGVRTGENPRTGRPQMVINSIIDARYYVAKYMTKGSDVWTKENSLGRIYAISNGLHFDSLSYKNVIDLATHPYYSDKKDLYRSVWATVGGVDPVKAVNVYNQIKEQL